MVGCRDSIIPKSATVVAEDDNVVAYLNQEDKSEIPQKSLWIVTKIPTKKNGCSSLILMQKPIGSNTGKVSRSTSIPFSR